MACVITNHPLYDIECRYYKSEQGCFYGEACYYKHLECLIPNMNQILLYQQQQIANTIDYIIQALKGTHPTSTLPEQPQPENVAKSAPLVLPQLNSSTPSPQQSSTEEDDEDDEDDFEEEDSDEVHNKEQQQIQQYYIKLARQQTAISDEEEEANGEKDTQPRINSAYWREERKRRTRTMPFCDFLTLYDKPYTLYPE